MSRVPVAKIKSQIAVKGDFDSIIRHISNGGSLTQLAKMWSCDYSELMKLIRSDKDKLSVYHAAIEDRKEWARERIFEELQYMGNYNIKDAVRTDGTMKTIQELPEDLARSIKEVDVDGSIKFQDKLKALDQKQKLLGLQTEKVEVSGKLTLADIIIGAKNLKDDEL
jgi:hypothetical protein